MNRKNNIEYASKHQFQPGLYETRHTKHALYLLLPALRCTMPRERHQSRIYTLALSLTTFFKISEHVEIHSQRCNSRHTLTHTTCELFNLGKNDEDTTHNYLRPPPSRFSVCEGRSTHTHTRRHIRFLPARGNS